MECCLSGCNWQFVVNIISSRIRFADKKWDPPHPVLDTIPTFSRFPKIIVDPHTFLRIVKTCSERIAFCNMIVLTSFHGAGKWSVPRDSCFFGEIRTRTPFLGPWRHFAGFIFSQKAKDAENQPRFQGFGWSWDDDDRKIQHMVHVYVYGYCCMLARFTDH